MFFCPTNVASSFPILFCMRELAVLTFLQPSGARKNLHLTTFGRSPRSSSALSLPFPVLLLSCFSYSIAFTFGSTLTLVETFVFSICDSCSHSERGCVANLVTLYKVGPISIPSTCRAKDTLKESPQLAAESLFVILKSPRTSKIGSGVVAPISVAL